MLGITGRMSVFLCALACALLLSAGLAVASIAPVPAPIPISSGSHQGRPDVNNDLIVWKRYLPQTGWDIFFYDKSKPGDGEQLATNAPGDQINPVTNGSKLIWEDWSSGTGEIYSKEPSSPPELLVTGPGNQAILSVSGNRLVYVNNTNPCPPNNPNCPSGANDAGNDIYMVDLANPAHTPVSVCSDPGSQWQPRISGTKVVWQDKRNGHFDIYMKDLSAPGSPEQLTASPGNDTYPDISGNIVVWQRTIGNTSTIWMKDLDSSEEAHEVDAGGSYQSSPRVNGDLITWWDNSITPGTWNIRLKDLTSGAAYDLWPSNSNQVLQAMDGETLVWEEYPTSNPFDDSIWMTTYPDTTPPSISDLTPDDGADIGCDTPVVSATYSDNRTGIDTTSVSLELDGEDVTAESTVTDTGISYKPSSPLGPETHTAVVSATDQSGNEETRTWQFTTQPRQLQLSLLSSFWASGPDYTSRELSVQFRMNNASSETPVLNVGILAASATGGVIMVTPEPPYIGNIEPLKNTDFVLKYSIPVGAGSFRTTVYAGCTDECGDYHYIPGPPPGP